ncbi:hypothetical protein H5410_003596 [Solanum commersonii]|uniref:Uncharacterized protein n=1 Tax=Solanum commersonii TaxID=4109 RepID=A0A9J6B630_SOLCO|nr:hypothetical protein H5410_003596 [Solanum commersonii]
MASYVSVRPSYAAFLATSSISLSVSASDLGSVLYSTLPSSPVVAGGIYGTYGISTIPKIMNISRLLRLSPPRWLLSNGHTPLSSPKGINGSAQGMSQHQPGMSESCSEWRPRLWQLDDP